jgi:hypothetical protein
MRRLAALMTMAAIAVTGCGVRPTGAISAGEAPTAEATALPESTLYFIKSGMLVSVTRSVSPWDDQAVFNALVAGPTKAERARGLSSGLTGVGGIEVLSGGADKLGMPGSEVIMLRLKPTTMASAKNPFGIGSKMIIGQLACTSQALATRPITVELLPSASSAESPQQIPAFCDKFQQPVAVPPTG